MSEKRHREEIKIEALKAGHETRLPPSRKKSPDQGPGSSCEWRRCMGIAHYVDPLMGSPA
jgi:hypothetical protein